MAAFERIEAARGATTLTFFEYNTLAALLIFAARRCEVAVLEVGLGGRLDATNLIDADVAVLASVGLDHRDWLGDTLELIGAEKAGIVRAGRPAVLGTPRHARERVRRDPCAAARRRWWPSATSAGSWARRGWDYRGLQGDAHAGCRPRRWPGPSSTATPPPRSPRSRRSRRCRPRRSRACSACWRRSTAANAAQGLRSVHLPGRFQVVPGEVEWILDIAHNEPAAQVLAAQLRARRCRRRHGRHAIAVIGVLADKDAAAIAAALGGLIDHWIVCALPGAARRQRGGSSPRAWAARPVR